MPVTSGAVATFPWDQRRIIDHAARRAGVQPQMVSAENIVVAQELLSSILSEWCNAGFPLWTRQYILLGCQVGSTDVTTPAGTLEVIHAYWRQFMPWRGGATLSSGVDGSVLFAGSPNADVTIAGPNPAVTVNFGSATELDTIGVLLGGSSSVTTALQLQTSADGITFTTVQTLPSATYAPRQWTYFDLNPTVTAQYVRLLYSSSGSLILNQLNFGLANGTDTMIGPLNIDDYFNLPNKIFQGNRAVSAFVDRQLNTPVIKIWNTLNTQGFYAGTVAALVRRYIQDPGQMTNAIEVPQRAIEALTWRLASMLIYEIPAVEGGQNAQLALAEKAQRLQLIEPKASKAESLFWSEERNKSPIRLVPNIRPYTA